MGLLDDLGSAWQEVEQVGETVFHDLEDVVSHLGSLGVPSFPSLQSFIELLVHEGENPFTFIPNLVSEIVRRGGSIVDTLEELASGFLHEGPQNYISRLTRRVIDPIIDTVHQHTRTANALGTLHQSTLSQVQNKLTTLSQGGNGTIPFQGKAAQAIQDHFTAVSGKVNKLIAPMTSGGGSGSSLGYDTPDPWATFLDDFGSINRDFVHGLDQMPTLVRSFTLAELAAAGIGLVIGGSLLVATAGAGIVIEVPIWIVVELVLVVVEIAVLAVWFVADVVIWLGRLIGALVVLGVEEIQYHSQGTSSITTHALIPADATLPNPKLTPEEEAFANDLFNEFGGKVPRNVLEYLVKMLGASKLTAAMIRCLYENGYLDVSDIGAKAPALTSNFDSAWQAIANHLNPNDLEGAWKEMNPGEVDPSTITNTTNVSNGQHDQEVNNALKAIKAFIKSIDNKLGDLTTKITRNPDSPDMATWLAQKTRLQNLRDAYAKLRDFIQSKIAKGSPSPDTWPDQGQLPIVEELLQVSPCKVPDAKYFK